MRSSYLPLKFSLSIRILLLFYTRLAVMIVHVLSIEMTEGIP